jgi:hypothetical protein
MKIAALFHQMLPIVVFCLTTHGPKNNGASDHGLKPVKP